MEYMYVHTVYTIYIGTKAAKDVFIRLHYVIPK
jgi:hypothetical protein